MKTLKSARKRKLLKQQKAGYTMSMNKKLILSILALALAVPAATIALTDREINLQFSRSDQLIGRIQSENDRLKGQIRQLERDNAALKKSFATVEKQLIKINDDILKFQNVDLSNLKAGQKRLYDSIPVLNWGTETRACKGLGEHQQIKVSQSPDGSHTLRYLCYDGRALHLGTEVHTPPQ